MQKINPFLWFDTQAYEAAKFYVSIFKNSKILDVTRYHETGAKATGMPAGSVMMVKFKLAGQTFIGLNCGPQFKFNEAISFVVNCQTQKEVDTFWKKLSAGGETSHCGWLKDKYGLSWQITPTVLLELMGDNDTAKAQRVMQSMLGMDKLDIKTLQQAAKSRASKIPQAPMIQRRFPLK